MLWETSLSTVNYSRKFLLPIRFSECQELLFSQGWTYGDFTSLLSFFLSILPLCKPCDDAGVQEVSACYISSSLFLENVILVFKSAYTQNRNGRTWRHGIYLEHKVCICNSWRTAVLYVKPLPVLKRSSFQFCAVPSLPPVLIPAASCASTKLLGKSPPRSISMSPPSL